MKVVIIHTDFRIYWPARLRKLNLAMKTQGMALHVIEISGSGSPYAFAKSEIEQDLSWKVLFPSDKMEDLKNKDIENRVLNELDAQNPDVVIAGAIAFPSGALAVRWTRKRRKKVIIFDDAKIEDVRRSCLVNFVKKSIYKGVDAMFYPSKKWEATGYFWNFKSEQLFYGLDVVDNAFWQRPINIDNSLPKKYFLCIGRQIPKKNFLFTLEAYKNYLQKVENPYSLLMVGDGSEHEKLVEYVMDNGLSDFVIFKQFTQQKDLLAIYRQAEVLIMASRSDETWGLVINEAMASGKPVIVSKKCGAASTLVKKGMNGFVFSPFCVNDLSDVLVAFHKLPLETKKRMGYTSLQTIEHWDLDLFAESLISAVNYVQSSKSRSLNFIEKILINKWGGRYNPI